VSMDDVFLARATEVERCIVAMEQVLSDPNAPDEAFYGAVEKVLEEFKAGGLGPHHDALWERFQAGRRQFAARLEERRQVSARTADALIADIEAARRAVEAALTPKALGAARSLAGDMKRRANNTKGILPQDQKRVAAAIAALNDAVAKAVTAASEQARERQARLQEVLDEMHRILQAEQLDREGFMKARDQAEAMLREGGLQDRYRELRDEFEEYLRAFRAREDERRAASAALADRVAEMANRALEVAKAASTPAAVIEAKAMAREARGLLASASPMTRQDRERVRAALDAMSAAIDEAEKRSDALQRGAVDTAIAAAREALETGDFATARTRLKAAREAASGLSPAGRQTVYQELDQLFARLSEERQAARAEWRAHQERKLEEFREKADRTRLFIERQEEAALRCVQQAKEARSEAYAERMRRYAEEHKAKAEEGRAALARLDAIIQDIERQLAGRGKPPDLGQALEGAQDAERDEDTPTAETPDCPDQGTAS